VRSSVGFHAVAQGERGAGLDGVVVFVFNGDLADNGESVAYRNLRAVVEPFAVQLVLNSPGGSLAVIPTLDAPPGDPCSAKKSALIWM
jgi:hypothetical protein